MMLTAVANKKKEGSVKSNARMTIAKINCRRRATGSVCVALHESHFIRFEKGFVRIGI